MGSKSKKLFWVYTLCALFLGAIAANAGEPVKAAEPTKAAAAPLIVAEQPHVEAKVEPVVESHSESRLRHSVAVEGGAVFASANVTSQIYDGNCCRTGFLFGGRLDWELSDSFSLFPGLRFIQKGGRARTNGPDLMIALNYLEVPLHVKYRFPGTSVRPYVFGGPNVAFLTSGEANSFNVPVRDVRPVTSSMDFSLEAGLGVDIAVDDHFSVYFANSYSLGLTDIDNSPDGWQSRNFQFTGGVKISF